MQSRLQPENQMTSTSVATTYVTSTVLLKISLKTWVRLQISQINMHTHVDAKTLLV